VDSRELRVRQTEEFGKMRFYPMNIMARLATELLGRQSLNASDLLTLKAMGFAITQALSFETETEPTNDTKAGSSLRSAELTKEGKS